MDNQIWGLAILIVIFLIYRHNHRHRNGVPNATNNSQPETLVNQTTAPVVNNERYLSLYQPYPSYFLIDPNCPYDIDDPLYYTCAYDPYIFYENDYPFYDGYRSSFNRPGYRHWIPSHHRPPHFDRPSRPHIVHPPSPRPSRPSSPRPSHSPRPSRPSSPRPGRR